MENTEKTFCKYNVEIGGETFEEIKYADYSDSVTYLRELMDIRFTLWDRITIPFYGLKRRVKSVFNNILYGFQRMFKGYDNVEIYDIFYSFIEHYSKIFTKFKENKCGHPYDMTEEEWDNILDEMITHLYYMDESNVNKELENGMSKEWSPTLETIGKIMDRHKERFFELFSKHFYNLWD